MVTKFDYAGLQSEVKDIIDEFGFGNTEAYIIKMYSPVAIKFYEKPEFKEELSCYVVPLPLSRQDNNYLVSAGYNEVSKYSKLLLTGVSESKDPSVGNYVVTSQDCYKIIAMKIIKPYDVNVLNVLYVEKATEPAVSVTVLAQEDGLIITQEDGKAIGVVI